jgi:hypothetical protein
MTEAPRIDWSDESQWVGLPAEAIPGEEPTPIAQMPPPGSPFVAIGVPCMDFVDTEFSMCFAAMMAGFRGLTAMLHTQSCYIDEARMEFVNQAKRRRIRLPDGKIVRPSHLLQIDSDMTFPAMTPQRLLSHKSKDVVGCVYSRRVEPYTNIGITEDQSIVNAPENSPLIPMMLIPTGMMMIHMSVFDRMPEFDEDGPVFGYKWLPGVNKYEREDVRFCRLVRENGMKVWCDVGLSHHIGHVGKAVYMVDEASKRLAAISGAKQVRDANTGEAAPVQTETTPAQMVDISKAVKTHAPDAAAGQAYQPEAAE